MDDIIDAVLPVAADGFVTDEELQALLDAHCDDDFFNNNGEDGTVVYVIAGVCQEFCRLKDPPLLYFDSIADCEAMCSSSTSASGGPRAGCEDLYEVEENLCDYDWVGSDSEVGLELCRQACREEPTCAGIQYGGGWCDMCLGEVDWYTWAMTSGDGEVRALSRECFGKKIILKMFRLLLVCVCVLHWLRKGIGVLWPEGAWQGGSLDRGVTRRGVGEGGKKRRPPPPNSKNPKKKNHLYN